MGSNTCMMSPVGAAAEAAKLRPTLKPPHTQTTQAWQEQSIAAKLFRAPCCTHRSY